MTRINLEVALLGDKPPLRALYHPDLNQVSVYAKDDVIDFSIVLTLPQYNSFLNDIERANIAIGEQAVKEVEEG